MLSLDATSLDPSPWGEHHRGPGFGRFLAVPCHPLNNKRLSGQEEPWSTFSVLSKEGSKSNPCSILPSIKAFVSPCSSLTCTTNSLHSRVITIAVWLKATQLYPSDASSAAGVFAWPCSVSDLNMDTSTVMSGAFSCYFLTQGYRHRIMSPSFLPLMSSSTSTVQARA